MSVNVIMRVWVNRNRRCLGCTTECEMSEMPEMSRMYEECEMSAMSKMYEEVWDV